MAPGTPAITAPTPGGVVLTTAPEVTGSGLAGATVTLTVSDVPDPKIVSTSVAGDGTWS